MKYHRFLTRVEDLLNRGRFLVFLYGSPIFMSDKFYYQGKCLSLIDCLKEYLFQRGITNIAYLYVEGDSLKVSRNYQTSYQTFKSDDLGEFEDMRQDSSGIQNASSETASRNLLEMVNRELRSFSPKTSAVIFDKFDVAAKIYFSVDGEAETIIKNSLLLWKDQTHHYCFLILRTLDIQAIQSYGIDRELFIEIYQPSPQEIAYFLIKEALKRDKILHFPLSHASKYAEDKTTLERAIEDFTQKLSSTPAREVNFLESHETDRWSWSRIKLNRDTKEKIKRIFEGFQSGKSGVKGIILYGPPGTGKTTVAKVLADEGGMYFKKTSASDFKGEYLGHSVQMTRRVFEELRALKPAILLIDEADSILMSRKAISGRGGDTYTLEIVNEFLANIDGLKDEGGIFIVISTNNPEYLDEAIRSRFEMIEIPLPDEETLRELILEYLGTDYLDLAEILEGYSGRDIKNLSEKLKQTKISKEELRREILSQKLKHLIAEFEPFKLEAPKKGGFNLVYGYEEQKRQILESFRKGTKKFAILGDRKSGKSHFTDAFLSEIDSFCVKVTQKNLETFDYLYNSKLRNLRKLIRQFRIALVIDLDDEPPEEIDILSEDFLLIVNSYPLNEIIDELEARNYEIITLSIDYALIETLIEREVPELKRRLTQEELNALIQRIWDTSFITVKRKLREELRRLGCET